MGPKKHKIEIPVVIYIIIGVFTFFRFAVFKKWHAKKIEKSKKIVRKNGIWEKELKKGALTGEPDVESSRGTW